MKCPVCKFLSELVEAIRELELAYVVCPKCWHCSVLNLGHVVEKPREAVAA